MTGKTHQIIGLTTGLGYYFLVVQPEYAPATLSAVIIGSHLASLIPDFDQGAADFWRSIPMGRVAGKVVDPFVSHRDFSHSFLGVGIISFLFYSILQLFPKYWGVQPDIVFWSMTFAYSSHILADAFTVQGIPLFYPYKKMFGIPPKPFHGMRIMTGKWFENLIIFPIVNLILLSLIIANWQTIRSILFK